MDKHPIPITSRDRLFLAWQAALAFIRLLEASANEEGVKSEAGRLFASIGEDLCLHASSLLTLLEKLKSKA